MKVTTNGNALSQVGFDVPNFHDLDITIEWNHSGWIRTDLNGFDPDYNEWLDKLPVLQEMNELEEEDYS